MVKPQLSKDWPGKDSETMSAYVITDVEVTDASLYGQFSSK